MMWTIAYNSYLVNRKLGIIFYLLSSPQKSLSRRADQPLQRLHRDAHRHTGVLAHLLVQAGFFALLVPDYMETRSAAAAERGRHDELLAKHGTYTKLCELQGFGN